MNQSDAAQRIAELREQIHHHDYRYYVEARPEVSDAEYDALVGAARAGEPVPRAGHARQPHPARGRPAPSTPSRPSSIAWRCSRSTTRPPAEQLREFEARMGRALPGHALRLRVRAEDRRARRRAPLPARPPRARRHAGRRAHGRGRHPEPAHDPQPARARCAGRLAGVARARGARRGLHAARGFAKLNRRWRRRARARSPTRATRRRARVRQKDRADDGARARSTSSSTTSAAPRADLRDVRRDAGGAPRGRASRSTRAPSAARRSTT